MPLPGSKLNLLLDNYLRIRTATSVKMPLEFLFCSKRFMKAFLESNIVLFLFVLALICIPSRRSFQEQISVFNQKALRWTNELNAGNVCVMLLVTLKEENASNAPCLPIYLLRFSISNLRFEILKRRIWDSPCFLVDSFIFVPAQTDLSSTKSLWNISDGHFRFCYSNLVSNTTGALILQYMNVFKCYFPKKCHLDMLVHVKLFLTSQFPQSLQSF